jgi:hypothetical protein
LYTLCALSQSLNSSGSSTASSAASAATTAAAADADSEHEFDGADDGDFNLSQGASNGHYSAAVAYSDDTVAGTSSSTASGVGDADRDTSSSADRSRRATHHFDTLVSLSLLQLTISVIVSLFVSVQALRIC